MDLSCAGILGVPVPLSNEKKRKLDEAAINCIIIDGRPWGDFRRDGMSQFLKVAVPGYTGPCSRTVQRNLFQLYNKKKKTLKTDYRKHRICQLLLIFGKVEEANTTCV